VIGTALMLENVCVARSLIALEVAMSGSNIVGAAIGLVLVFLLFSLLCSTINEWIARLLALRSSGLRNGINELLADGTDAGIAAEFHKHPLIDVLKPKHAPILRRVYQEARAKYPSYIAPQTFAQVVMALTMKVTPPGAPWQDAIATLTTNDKIAFNVLQPLLQDVEGNAVAIRERLATWFDDSMDRLSGWYKRRIQVILFFVALILSAAWNVDSISLTKRLLRDPILREAMVKNAAALIDSNRVSSATPGKGEAAVRIEALEQEGLLFGWSSTCPPIKTVSGCPTPWSSVLGIFLTTIALTLGAPFWFDTLNKLVNIRQSGTPPSKTS
jgi:hypothetical protein